MITHSGCQNEQPKKILAVGTFNFGNVQFLTDCFFKWLGTVQPDPLVPSWCVETHFVIYCSLQDTLSQGRGVRGGGH